MTIEQKITEINQAITAQIAKLRIPLPENESQLWNKKMYGKCVLREQMDKGEQALIEVDTKQWVTADDAFDFISAHLYEDGFNNHELSGYDFSRIGFDVNMKLVVLSNKKMAFNLVFEALKEIKVEVINMTEDYNRVTKEYFAMARVWGVNPDYRALMIDYKINIPFIEKPDYTVID